MEKMEKRKTAPESPSPNDRWRLVRGVRSSDDHYVLIEGPTGKHWLSASHLTGDDRGTLNKLGAAIGMPFVTSRIINSLKEAVQEFADYKEGAVATQPGWIGTAFALGTGEIVQATNDASQYISVINPDARFEPAGTLRDWHAAIHPLIEDQPLLRFLIGFSLAPVLLAWATSDILNPIMELYGDPEAGKTTAFTLMASMWAGDSKSTVGGGVSGDMTPLYLDVERRRFAGMCLPLDELETITDAKQRWEMIVRLVFGGSGTETRKRLTDSLSGPSIRSSIVMTANTSLEEFGRGQPEERQKAMSTRVTRIRLTQVPAADSFAIFEALPTGYSEVTDAVKALMATASKLHGIAGPHFAKEIVGCLHPDPKHFQTSMMAKLGQVRSEIEDSGLSFGDRHLNRLALVATTLIMAEEVGTLLPGRQTPTETVLWIARRLKAKDEVVKRTKPSAALRRLVRANRRRFLPLSKLFLKSPWYASENHGCVDEAKSILYLQPQWLESRLRRPDQSPTRLKALGILCLTPSEAAKRNLTATPSTLLKLGFDRRVYAVSLKAIGLNSRLHRAKDGV
ncbi:DUF927 domain-containing protein [Neorhizobium galegae]|uniref:DUF927 domain-containing protein n=1 Tax=Neorhizobium galegae TaxID=399 RepID=UPI002101C47D|nr:DUF927 domain-containing protein [Neorhizobium galegae]MCQ1573490.1 DUF927 domain-containing protein [Neorhizobium galegae]